MSDWSNNQFKKSKVRGNERTWEKASQELEALLIQKEIERTAQKLARLRALKEEQS